MKRYLLAAALILLMLFVSACASKGGDTGIDVSGTRKTSGVEVISSSGGAIADGFYEVSGEVQNKGGKDASFIKVKVSLYDANKQLIDENEVLVDIDVLAAGDKASFTVNSSKGGIADSVSSFKLSVSHR